MYRRDFLKQSAAALAVSSLPRYVEQLADTRKRVGLIGTGWYGKSDLLRLIQVAPVEVVSLCDVDKQMLADAADLVATRQASKKKPRTFSDYREMLKPRRISTSCSIGTPDHWHALPMIEAVKAGARRVGAEADQRRRRRGAGHAGGGAQVQARGAGRHAAAQHAAPGRARATASSAKGLLGTIGLVEIYCYYHMRATENPPDTAPPANLDYEMWTGPAPMRPYNKLVHPRSWRAFMEYGNGIVGDMCVHMLDMVRWMLDLGMADAHRFVWRHPRRQGEQGQHHRHADRRRSTSPTCRSSGRTARYGDAPDPKYPWGATFYGDKGTLKASVMGYDFVPSGKGQAPIHEDVTYELDQFPRTGRRRISNSTSRRRSART